MVDYGKHSILGVMISAMDYASAVAAIVDAAQARKGFGVSALAVHGVMTGVFNEAHMVRLNSLALVLPDGQPVRWALRILHGARLRDRVYGPTLTLRLCEEAARLKLPVYFYGSSADVIERLQQRLPGRAPGLLVAGGEPSRFRRITAQEKAETVARISASGARILFVGLGCPRQEVFAYEFAGALGMPVIAVGAAFDYHSGLKTEPALWIQSMGLQWLFRLIQEPRRLWRRYLTTNIPFCVLFMAQWAGIWRPKRPNDDSVSELLYG